LAWRKGGREGKDDKCIHMGRKEREGGSEGGRTFPWEEETINNNKMKKK